jgi:choline dehydrogenase-like flavoprotein
MSVGWLRACALVMLGLFSVTALAKDKTAIVIGGGLSGLTAAYELQNKGWQVTLLEAKPSLGGRSGMATSEWIGNDKTQPVLNKYVSTFKLGTTPAPEFVRTPGYLIDGEYFSAADLATKQPATADALKRYQKTLDDLARSIDDQAEPAGHRASADQPGHPHPLRRAFAPVAAVFRPAEPRVSRRLRPRPACFASGRRQPGTGPGLRQADQDHQDQLAGFRDHSGQGRRDRQGRQCRLPG